MTSYKHPEQVKDEINDFIPWDKSWIIRMGILDLSKGYSDIINFLETQQDLGKDLEALLRVARAWNQAGPIDVGESGTIYRFVRFYLWQDQIDRQIITSGTLTKRAEQEICCDPDLVNWAPEKLGTLDHGTSQWQTMAYLLRDARKVVNPKYKLKLTYDAVDHWQNQRAQGKIWQPRKDLTLFNQAFYFLNILNRIDSSWQPEQAEDYCFARAFDIVDENALNDRRWKDMFESVEGHETPRVEEMTKALYQFQQGNKIDSRDHRVVQSMAMLEKSRNPGAHSKFIRETFINPDCVSKSWPRFWEFITYADDCYLAT
jgi:hypothetical protein